MKHRYSLEGYSYKLRPVKKTDAAFIVEARLEDAARNQYIHPISEDVSLQEAWLERYFEREGDYYFIVENRFTGNPEGLIAIYEEANGSAEWGRWVIKKASLAASESVYLLYRIAFEQIGLKELYCRTVADNTAVVSFHNSIGEKTRTVHKGIFELNGNIYDAVEQYSEPEHFYSVIAPKLEKQAKMVAGRNMKRAFGEWTFHHIGVATKSIEKELPVYTLMGYEKLGEVFEDPAQGIRGLFLTAKDQPCLELLENLPDSHTLDKPLENGQKFYHTAYYVGDIEAAMEVFRKNRAKVISPLKESVYFGKRICFMMLPNMQLIELLER